MHGNRMDAMAMDLRRRSMKRSRTPMRLGAALAAALPLLALGLAGCETFQPPDWYFDLTRPRVQLPPPPEGELVYRAGHWSADSPQQPGTLAADCAGAKVLFQRGDIADAEKVFAWLARRAEKEKEMEVLEEALYYDAECLYRLRQYPKARDLYAKLLQVFPSSRFRGEAVARQFEIAQHWLEDTKDEMKAWEEFRDGKRWLVMPKVVSFEPEKPTFDQEGHALKSFQAIYMQDPAGPHADQALYLAGGINFFRQRYEDADTYYSLLVENYPRSRLTPQALELAIQSKINQAGGPEHDGRKLTEARRMIDAALRSYPELRDKEDFLERTLYQINEQQAAKDFGAAEFYRRTGHPGAAYVSYEVVRRRYAGTNWAEKALARMKEIRGEVEAEAAKVQAENQAPPGLLQSFLQRIGW
jgi:outer membrane protein assembly factor BamD (BamD/ComL family)